MRTTIFLGAPLASSLTWAEAPPFPAEDWENDTGWFYSQSTRESSSEHVPAQWRVLKPNVKISESGRSRCSPELLSLNNDCRLTGWPSERNGLCDAGQPEGDSTVLVNINRTKLVDSHERFSSPQNDTSDYLESSFAVHEAIIVSQSSDEDSMLDSLPDRFEHRPQHIVPKISTDEIAFTTVTKLKDLPSAKHLSSVIPQTITINVVVGIVSISPPKTVTAGRRFGRERQIDVVELLVGDDSKSAFEISLWLPRDLDPKGEQMKQSLQQLRPRDVILLRNLALGSFRGTVTGSSLRRDTTKIDLLYGLRPEPELCVGVLSHKILPTAVDVCDTSQVLQNTRKVKRWLAHYVGECISGDGEKSYKRALPPDTQ